MIEPKIFYRKLDFILNRIGRGKTEKDFLFTIIKELENTFQNDLHICKGRVYEEYEDEYVLMTPEEEGLRGDGYAKYLPINSAGVQAVLKYHLYIFDNPVLSIDSRINSGREYAIPVALSVHSAEYRWILIFELMSGWLREEVELCLNAVRTMLNYRLYSESMKNEMVQAANIQQSLLPSSPPQISGYEIAGLSKPAEIVGGDLFDYYQFNGSNFGVSIGDASGHGIPAALLVRDVVTGLRMGIGENDGIKDKLKAINSFRIRRLNENRTLNILKKLNRVIFKSTYSTRFVSLFIAEFDSAGNFFYVNAGHPSPILIKNKSITELDSTGPIFGAMPEINLSGSNAKISSGDILVLFTDGIIERQDNLNEQYGIGRLRELVYSNRNKSAGELKDLIFNSVLAFGKSNEWEDDATILVIKKK